MNTCFHCGEALAQTRCTAKLRAAEVAVCCPGCKAAVELIGGMGLDDFYTFRTLPAPRPPDARSQWVPYDSDEMLAACTEMTRDGRTVMLTIDGMTCAACGWLLRRSLEQLPGVREASVNTATGRARVVWDDAAVPLSRVLGVIAGLGYQPAIATADGCDARRVDERRALLKRLAVSGAGMMQVMMFAVALYMGDTQGMDTDVRAYLRLVSMLVSTPVMLYGGWPYFTGALQALCRRTVTMDVPVALGLLLAYAASVFDTWRGRGAVYFDSVTMFIFFLTVARYVEMVARHQSTRVSDSLARMLPGTAHRLQADGLEDIAVSQVAVGDHLLIRCGEIVPADGTVVAGDTELDESMLTGESAPVTRSVGGTLAAGTLNVGSPVTVEVTATGRATVLAGIVALLNRAQAERPRITRDADRRSSWFLVHVLLGAALVCAFWCVVNPARAFDATLSVLVIACPCAFSLATLVAVASANAALARRGVLVAGADAIEGLAKVTHVVFDKTGTLTDGTVSIARCTPTGALAAESCMQIAAALEAASEHPLARAFAGARHPDLPAEDVAVASGGVSGTVRGTRYRIGTRCFTRELPSTPALAADAGDALIYLRSSSADLATFSTHEEPRPECSQVVGDIRGMAMGIEILSGDSLIAVRRLARRCGISAFAARQSPAQKLQRVRQLAARGEFVAMVGDGMNDAPGLGGAGVSIAMSRGSALALASADLILVGDSLRALPGTFMLARRARRIIRQNLVWAAGYNLTAMPLAAAGVVPPWAAAIGMSVSSIVVVLNSLRLIRAPRTACAAGGSRPTSPQTAAPPHALQGAFP